MNPGKRFEEKFRKSAERDSYVMRIPDRVYLAGGRLLSEQSEADFIVVNDISVYMVECKATNRPRLEFYNVKEHQEKSLAEFSDYGLCTHGLLAVEFYDKESYRNPKRMFLMPIEAWMRYKDASNRKSMPLAEFERSGIECELVNGLYRIDFRAVSICA